MNVNYDFIGSVIDMSGSMFELRSDVIGGYNRYMEDQKNNNRKADSILTTFNNKIQIGEIQDVQNCTILNNENYIPDGLTAMRDAICLTINKIGDYLNKMNEKDRPANVFFYIQTDGKENASKEFSHSKMVDMIKHQTDVYKWKFIFAGANIDAFETGGSMGISKQFTQQFEASSEGIRKSYADISRMVTSLRCDPNSNPNY